MAAFNFPTNKKESVLTSSGGGNITTTEGGQSKVMTANITQEQLLSDMLKELKIINIQLAILTGNEIEEGEIG
jgi:hypothetical protein